MTTRLDLDRAWNDYDRAVHAIAKREWTKSVKPWLDTCKVSFSQCNGDWWLTWKGLDYQSTSIARGQGAEDLMKASAEGRRVFAILQAEVPGYPTVSLANFMPASYTPK